ncbi:hypothetical protein ACHAPG_004912 [Botrytis cinerea]
MQDYTRRDNAPFDPMEVVYNVNSNSFTFKRRSELVVNGRLGEDVKSILVPLFHRKVKIDVIWEPNSRLGHFDDLHKSSKVELPLGIWFRRNVLGLHKDLYICR